MLIFGTKLLLVGMTLFRETGRFVLHNCRIRLHVHFYFILKLTRNPVLRFHHTILFTDHDLVTFENIVGHAENHVDVNCNIFQELQSLPKLQPVVVFLEVQPIEFCSSLQKFKVQSIHLKK